MICCGEFIVIAIANGKQKLTGLLRPSLPHHFTIGNYAHRIFILSKSTDSEGLLRS